MSSINFEKISKECKAYIKKELLKVLPEYSNNASLRNLVEYETTNFKNFHIHDTKKREKRNEFFSELIANINCHGTVEKLKKYCLYAKFRKVILTTSRQNLNQSHSWNWTFRLSAGL
ncbi:hypothetical protein [Pectobacterium parmentieri]|uniref:hypothetical protein n=1 Tax=Pectobacterium parmentieri TaxID=1905730 RepID=UPI0004743E63|nr:hypothetical protein [Pectobacterium parmentieri]PWD67102.1 hypothetical protein DF211_05060 [Pectobacterium parmentieri]